MRCRNFGCRVVLGHRPFADGTGASLYIGTSAEAINYRRHRIVGEDSSGWWPVSTEMINPGAAEVPKCQRVASVMSPDAELTYTLPVALRSMSLWYQVRTFSGDYENESIYRPQQVSTDSAGDGNTPVVASAVITGIEKRDGGGVRIRWAYTRSTNGAQPTSFVVAKTTGAGTVASVTRSVTRERLYYADLFGLADGVSYTFSLAASDGNVSTILVSGIAVTGDDAGPPGVSGLVAVAY